MRLLVAVVVAWLGGCTYQGREPAGADADPLAPDAETGAPDGEPGAPDAEPAAADAAITIDAPAASCPGSYDDLVLGGSRYRVDNSADSWTAAAADCANDGATTHLVVLSSDVERIALAVLMDRPRFVGISDRIADDRWIPVTDEDVGGYDALYLDTDAPPWAIDHPDDTGDCVVLLDGNLALEDRDCINDEQPYLCECDAFADDPANYELSQSSPAS